jgi:hypothetical protein
MEKPVSRLHQFGGGSSRVLSLSRLNFDAGNCGAVQIQIAWSGQLAKNANCI